MEPHVLEALKGSIEKWRKIVKEGGENKGTENCPLCQLFHCCANQSVTEKNCCKGCPVYEYTGAQGCHYTPYVKYVIVLDEYPIAHPLAIEAAKEELEFLRSLLPEGEK